MNFKIKETEDRNYYRPAPPIPGFKVFIKFFPEDYGRYAVNVPEQPKEQLDRIPMPIYKQEE